MKIDSVKPSIGTAASPFNGGFSFPGKCSSPRERASVRRKGDLMSKDFFLRARENLRAVQAQTGCGSICQESEHLGS